MGKIARVYNYFQLKCAFFLEKKCKCGVFFPMHAGYAKPEINLPWPKGLLMVQRGSLSDLTILRSQGWVYLERTNFRALRLRENSKFSRGFILAHFQIFKF